MTIFTDFFNYPFLSYAFLGILLLSIVCGILSPFIIAKNYAFMGSAISHCAILGVATALAIVEHTNDIGIYLITSVITLICVAFLAITTFRQKLPSDSLIGIFYTTTMGLGIIIHQVVANGKGDILGYLFGNILLLTKFDVILCLLLLIIVCLSILPKLKTWFLFSYDEQIAWTQGVQTKIYHYVFYFLLTFTIVSSIKIAGTILINTLLLVPGVFALKYSQNTKKLIPLSVLFSVSVSLISLILANALDFPVGPTLSVCQFTILLIFLKLKK